MPLQFIKYWIFFLACFFLTPDFVKSQPDNTNSLSEKNEYLIQIKKLGLDEGFTSRSFSFVFQDREGFIWTHNPYGLDRYDGVRVKHYDRKPTGIRYDSPASMSQGKDGFIWLHYWKWPRNLGIDLFDTKTGNAITIQQYLINPLPFNEKEITAVMQSKEGGTFLGTRFGQIFKITNKSTSLYYDTGTGKPILRLFESPTNGIWVIFKERIFKLDDNRNIEKELNRKFLSKEDYSPLWDSQSNSFAEDSLGNLHYVQVHIKLDGQNKRTFHNLYIVNESKVEHPFDNYSVLAIAPKTLNRYVIVRYHGKEELILLSPQGEILSQIEYEGKHPIWMYFDKQENFWVNGVESLLQIRTQKLRFTTYLNDFKSYFGARYGARGIIELGENLIVNGLGYSYRINIKTSKISRFGLGLDYNYKGSRAGSNVLRQALEIDRSGNLWITNEEFWLTKYDPFQDTFTNYTYATESIKDFAKLHRALHISADGIIWLGHTSGLSYFDPLKKAIILLKNVGEMQPLEGASIIDIQEAKDGFWLLTTNGLFLFDSNAKSIIASFGEDEHGVNYLPSLNFTHIYKDKFGVLWLATKGNGIIRWDREKNEYKKIDKENGLSNNVIYAIYEDAHQNLWLPSDNGLNKYNKLTGEVSVYHVSDGIAHEEFNTNSHYRGADSTLYFGGLNGITAFKPSDFYKKSEVKKFPIVITDLKLRSKSDGEFYDNFNEYQTSGGISVTPDYIGLVLEFSHLEFKVSKRNFAYIIKGFDSEWTYISTPQVRINSLPYGKYSIILRAQENYGGWTEKSIPLIILSPIYLQTWFLLLVGLAFLTAILLLYKIGINRVKKNKDRLEYLVKQRTIQISDQANELQIQAIELKKLDKIKSKFFANISHEFRTPLTLIIGPLQHKLSTANSNITSKELEILLANANQLLDLINQLLDLAKSEQGKLAINIESIDIKEFVFEQIQPFISEAELKGIHIKYEISNDFVFDADRSKISRVFNNVLFNALKFSPKGGLVDIEVVRNKKTFTIEIADQGRGVADSEKEKIFERFYQLDVADTSQGTGIGLALAKEYTQLHNGTIKAINNIPLGTKFIIELPLSFGTSVGLVSKHKREEVPVSQYEKHPLNLTKNLSDTEEAPCLLIVEDHPEVLEYIVSCLITKYRIIIAKDGQEGLDKALDLIPDLIISDIMMPRKDGLEMTHELKENMSTSHIPIILLTAKASIENKVEGLNIGADGYITKPFSSDELLARVNNLIASREKLRTIYNNAIANAQYDELPLIEHKFIQLVENEIDKNIMDDNYNVEQLSNDLKINRTTLYRKLKALVDESPIIFIRTYRLKKAKSLLEQGEMNISEVAYKVGFNSIAYFSKSFKEEYGVAPSKLYKTQT